MSPLALALQDLRALDTLAARDTALARRDARAKLLVTLGFVGTVLSFDRYQLAALLPLALLPVVLAAQADLPPGLLWRTLWRASPFAVLMGLANPLLDRLPMLALGGVELSGGWVSFGSILLRFSLAVSAAVILVGGTGMHALCAALARLGAPRVFTVQLLFLYRYLFVLAEEALRMSTAYRLRAVADRRMGLGRYAGLAGHLLLRAVDRAQRIHAAMQARGFDGQLRVHDPGRWRLGDTLFVAGWGLYLVLVRTVDLPQAAGTALTDLVR